MILYCKQITPRIRYMADWLGNYFFNNPARLVTNTEEIVGGSFFINYSNDVLTANAYQIAPAGLLNEEGVVPQKIIISSADHFPIFFETNGHHSFDILSAAFFLLTRFEEYLPHEKDLYGRFTHHNSLAFKYDFLSRPLVDEWMQDLRERLSSFYPAINFKKRSFSYIPTYDIDIAWSYLHKGFLRSFGGLLKQAFKREWPMICERLTALGGKSPDPFDIFDDLKKLHSKYPFNPVYFFLLAEKSKGFDKNISPSNRHYQELIGQIAAENNTGIHLSWQASQQPALMIPEKQLLEKVTGKKVYSNRMHYIKFELPQTFEQLTALEIKAEYSMGYGSINGFRASTCTPYSWYNLSNETASSLVIYPFSYMDANSIYEQKDSPETALHELQLHHDTIKKLGGTMITIFHNHLVGYHKTGRDWWHLYENWLQNNF